MTKKQRNAIINYANKLSDDELEKEYYDSVYESLGSQTDDMYELGYDMQDIIERDNYEKFLCQRSSLLETLCEKRGILLWR